ncbi:MAG: tripartite tricarboxylate transporter permease, partial [Steroidobacteraceae bacterium]
MVWSIALANIVGAGLCYAFSGQFAKIATLRYTLVLPMVASIIFIGAFEGSRQWGDLISLLCFGTVGWTMKRFRWPRAPLILGVVLGDTIERQLFISIRLYGADWLLHPMVLVILLVALYGILRPMIQSVMRNRRRGVNGLRLGKPTFAPSDLFSVALLLALGYLLILTIGWPYTTLLVPRIVTITAMAAVGLSLVNSVFTRGVVETKCDDEEDQPLYMDNVGESGHLTNKEIVLRAGGFIFWMLAFLLSMATIGIVPTILWFVIAYMRFEGRERWTLVLPMAIGLSSFVYIVFDQLLMIAWPQTFMGTLFPVLQPFVPTLR